jgi:hypothetical protein
MNLYFLNKIVLNEDIYEGNLNSLAKIQGLKALQHLGKTEQNKFPKILSDNTSGTRRDQGRPCKGQEHF